MKTDCQQVSNQQKYARTSYQIKFSIAPVITGPFCLNTGNLSQAGPFSISEDHRTGKEVFY